jgi:hypothetical protein
LRTAHFEAVDSTRLPRVLVSTIREYLYTPYVDLVADSKRVPRVLVGMIREYAHTEVDQHMRIEALIARKDAYPEWWHSWLALELDATFYKYINGLKL